MPDRQRWLAPMAALCLGLWAASGHAQVRGSAGSFAPARSLAAVGEGPARTLWRGLAGAAATDPRAGDLVAALSRLGIADAASRRRLAPLAAALEAQGARTEALEGLSEETLASVVGLALPEAARLVAREAEAAIEAARKGDAAATAHGAYVLEGLANSALPYLEYQGEAGRSLLARIDDARREAKGRLRLLRWDRASTYRTAAALGAGEPIPEPSRYHSDALAAVRESILDLRRSSGRRGLEIAARLRADMERNDDRLFHLGVAEEASALFSSLEREEKDQRRALAGLLRFIASETAHPEARIAAVRGLLREGLIRSGTEEGRKHLLRAARSAAASGDPAAMGLVAAMSLHRLENEGDLDARRALWRAVDRVGGAAGGLGALEVPGTPPPIPRVISHSDGLREEDYHSVPRFWGTPLAKPEPPGFLARLSQGIESHRVYAGLLLGQLAALLTNGLVFTPIPAALLATAFAGAAAVIGRGLWHHHPVAALLQVAAIASMARDAAAAGGAAVYWSALAIAGFAWVSQSLSKDHKPIPGVILSLLATFLMYGLLRGA